MNKTHYHINIEQGNESDPTSGSVTLCGYASDSSWYVDWKFVNCKNCLKRRANYEKEEAFHMMHQANDMQGFVDFIKAQEKV